MSSYICIHIVNFRTLRLLNSFLDSLPSTSSNSLSLAHIPLVFPILNIFCDNIKMHLNVQINVSFYKVCEKVLTNHVSCIFKLKRDILIHGRQNDDTFSEKVDNWSRYTLCHCVTPIFYNQVDF